MITNNTIGGLLETEEEITQEQQDYLKSFVAKDSKVFTKVDRTNNVITREALRRGDVITGGMGAAIGFGAGAIAGKNVWTGIGGALIGGAIGAGISKFLRYREESDRYDEQIRASIFSANF